MSENVVAPLEMDDLTTVLLQLASTLQEQKCESLVVIGVNRDGGLVMFRRPGPVPQSYAMVGALAAVSREILDNEVPRIKPVTD